MSGAPPRQEQPRQEQPRQEPPRFKPPRTTQDFIRKGLARVDLQDPYYFAVSLGWKQFTVLFLGSELALNTVFALLYLAQPGAIANMPKPGFASAFFFSLETLATVGYGEMYPGTTYGHVISSLEILVGMAFTAIMTGLVLIRFTKPKAKVLYAENPVVCQHDGRPTLMLRIGNGRREILSNAEVSMHMLVRTVTAEGVPHAYLVELPLLRSRMPAFAILFTMMHEIDAASPLHGYHAAHPELDDLRLFVNLRGHDPAIGQVVFDTRNFVGSDIRFGMRYVDAVHRDENGKVVADYSRLGTIVPDMPGRDGGESGGKPGGGPA